MFLCNLDGKIYSDNDVSKKITFVAGHEGIHIVKEKEIEVCSNCYGSTNNNYKIDVKNRFIVKPNEKIKIYKISSSNFGVTDGIDVDDENNIVPKILKDLKNRERKKCKNKIEIY